MNNFRNLRANEIECRVGTVAKDQSGFSLLLYKDARCDMNILDETVGPLNWERKHEGINGVMFCTLSIWDKENNRWISKQDCGTKSNTEAEKGESSDSFKRAAFNFGIGRELYTSPFIWIQTSTASKTEKFYVSDIDYNDKNEISKLTIMSQKPKRVVYMFPSNNNFKNTNNTSTNTPPPTPNHTPLKCEKCGCQIDATVASWSNNHYGKQLCRACQKGVSN
ncbi:Rad52/Rad22 family DNA repair protein [Clostridium thermobutyricum]|uniref:Rad52/Rad22 family DNA repair protein n=1 Tax=Clostridium thermobutyricum TaxID=29372 RepID=UPI0018AA3AF0|nr:Rad52/Rad22 family DNA repair protein [Clostridium thermobutyricum]